MTGILASVVTWLAVAIGLIVAANIAILTAVRRNERHERRLRPGAELAVAEYLAGSAARFGGCDSGGRTVMLKVALEALADLRGSERARLVQLLEQCGFVAEARSGLRARRRTLRLRAAETLAVISARTAVPALTAGLADRDALVRTACARTLAEVGGDDVIPAVLATAERDLAVAPGPAAAVVLAIGASRPSALAPLLGGGRPAGPRAVAIAVAGALRLAQHAPLLQACLADGDQIAAAAARGLGLIGEARSVAALACMAADEDREPFARTAAAVALGMIGDVSALPVLQAQLAAADWSLRAAAAEALAGLGEPGAAALRRAAGSGPADVRALAMAALPS